MAIRDVEKAIREVRQTIRSYWYPHNHEASTRYALIDPIIRALGWETHDIKQCEVEYPIGDGKVDYALFDQEKYVEYEEDDEYEYDDDDYEDDEDYDDEDDDYEDDEDYDDEEAPEFAGPVILIEAKSLGADLTDPKYIRQLARYCREIGYGIGVLTDGQHWRLYDLESDKRPFPRKLFKIVDVNKGSIRQAARELHKELNKRRWW